MHAGGGARVGWQAHAQGRAHAGGYTRMCRDGGARARGHMCICGGVQGGTCVYAGGMRGAVCAFWGVGRARTHTHALIWKGLAITGLCSLYSCSIKAEIGLDFGLYRMSSWVWHLFLLLLNNSLSIITQIQQVIGRKKKGMIMA